MPQRGAALAGITLASAFWMVGRVWQLAAWNALRAALGARWRQAFVAAAVVCAALAGPARAALRAASA